MRQLFSLAAVLLLSTMLTSTVLAHSQLTESSPADKEVVTAPLNKIVLTFEGQIEQGSLIEVTSTSGQAIDIQDITIGEGTLTGTVANPLPNDDYQVSWSIISADGHPLEGEFTFTVDVPVSGTEVEEEMGITEVLEEETDTQLMEEQEATPEADDVDETSSSSMTMIVFILIAVVLAAILFFIFMKRKKK